MFYWFLRAVDHAVGQFFRGGLELFCGARADLKLLPDGFKEKAAQLMAGPQRCLTVVNPTVQSAQGHLRPLECKPGGLFQPLLHLIPEGVGSEVIRPGPVCCDQRQHVVEQRASIKALQRHIVLLAWGQLRQPSSGMPRALVDVHDNL